MSDLIHTSAADCPEAAARLDVLKEPVAPTKGRSTGPRSTPGKRRSSRNALKSGYFSKELAEHMRSKQDQEDFRRLLNGLLDYWKPVGQAELIEVELMANHLRDYKTIIRLRATQRGNANMDDIDFASATGTDGAVCEEWRADLPDFDNMEKFQRSESHFLGLYYRAVNTLQRMRLGEAVLSRLKANPNARPGPFLQNELS